MATQPGGGASLPIIFHRARAAFAAFPCPIKPLAALMPDFRLKPISLWPGKGALVVGVFDYQESSIGPYREVGLGVACRYRKSTAVPLFPLLSERWLEDVGLWVITLPVTTDVADRAGREIWGYPKYVGQISIETSENHLSCLVSEDGKSVLRVEIDRPGATKPIRLPLRTYSRLDDELLLTEAEIDGEGTSKRIRIAASLAIEQHPRNEALHDLPATFERPLEVRWFDEYRIKLDRARARYVIGR